MIKIKPDAPRPPVTKVTRGAVMKVDAEPGSVTKVVGRPKVHVSSAERQRAYRRRKGGKTGEIHG